MLRIKLNDQTKIDEFLFGLCDIWINTIDLQWEFTENVEVDVTEDEETQDLTWNKDDLMSLCPISQIWALNSHSWTFRMTLRPMKLIYPPINQERRGRFQTNLNNTRPLRYSQQYWMPPPTHEARASGSFKISEKLNAKSKPFKPRKSSEKKETLEEMKTPNKDTEENLEMNVFNLTDMKKELNSDHLFFSEPSSEEKEKPKEEQKSVRIFLNLFLFFF